MTAPRKATAAEHPCQLYAYHQPHPSRTQGHHRHPVYLQNQAYGQITDPELLWVCGTCHDNIHEWLGWLLGETREPSPHPGLYAKREAQRTYDWFQLAKPPLRRATDPTGRLTMNAKTVVGVGVAGLAAATLLTVAVVNDGTSSSAGSVTASPCTSSSPTPVRVRVIGADVNVPTGNTLANFQAADKLIGPLKVRRTFPTVTTIATVVAADKAAGYTSFVSLKPPLTNAQLTTVAKSLPAGTYITLNHEPENDMTGAQFVALFRNFYTVTKAANPALQVGPVHLTYAWRNPAAGVGASGTNTGLQPAAEWDVGDAYRDFTGADTYNAKGQALSADPEFQAWFKHFKASSAEPLRIIEYGQVVAPPGGTLSAADLTRRAGLISGDRIWLDSQPRVDMWLLWHATGAQGNWALNDPEGQAAWRKVAAG